MKKKTKYLDGIVALSLGSLLTVSCGTNHSSSDNSWVHSDTTAGKMVQDEKGNEWVWHGHGMTNMMMGYWLINNFASGTQSRYYPSSNQYTTDDDRRTTITRPTNVSSTPVKKVEGVLKTPPTADRPYSRTALKSGSILKSSNVKSISTPKQTSTRRGFGRIGGGRSFGS